MPSSPYTDGVGASSVARAGSNKAWANPANGLHHDNIYATAGTMIGGDKTENLVVASLPPNAPLATLPTLVQVKVEGFQSPQSGWTIRDDHVQLTNSGVLIGADAKLISSLDLTETSRVYNFDITGTGVTLADINAGNLGLQYGDRCYPLDPNTFNVGNWLIIVSPTSPDYVEAIQPLTHVTVFRVAAIWNGTPGLQPEGIVLAVTTACNAGGLGTRVSVGPPPVYDAAFSGNASADNGQGDTATGPILEPTAGPTPEFQGVTGTHSVYIALDQGGGTYGYHDFTVTGSVTLSPSNAYAYVDNHCSAIIATQPPVTVSIDSIQSSFTTAMLGGARHHFSRIPNIGMRPL